MVVFVLNDFRLGLYKPSGKRRKTLEKFKVKNRTLAKAARMRPPNSKARETRIQRRECARGSFVGKVSSRAIAHYGGTGRSAGDS